MADNTRVRTAATKPSAAHTVGAARVIALGYGFFTLAAGARSIVQLTTKFSVAPLAYLLSAVAAAIYLTGMIGMVVAERVPAAGRFVRRVCLVELGGVVAVGAASLVMPAAFPDATVWSSFGSSYAFVPVVLPVLALWWTTECRPGEVLLERARTPSLSSTASESNATDPSTRALRRIAAHRSTRDRMPTSTTDDRT